MSGSASFLCWPKPTWWMKSPNSSSLHPCTHSLIPLIPWYLCSDITRNWGREILSSSFQLGGNCNSKLLPDFIFKSPKTGVKKRRKRRNRMVRVRTDFKTEKQSLCWYLDFKFVTEVCDTWWLTGPDLHLWLWSWSESFNIKFLQNSSIHLC